MLTACLLSCGTVSNISQSQHTKQNNMYCTRFIPEIFNEIELGYSKTSQTVCSPGYPSTQIALNTITINTPDRIIINVKCDHISSVLPMCVTYKVSSRRSTKYHEDEMMVHLRMIEGREVYFGKIIDNDVNNDYVIPPYWNSQMEQNRRERILEAQKYSDEELNDGQASGGYMNLNIMEYVDMPFAPGRYEVWLSFYGLESNHCFTEIIAE